MRLHPKVMGNPLDFKQRYIRLIFSKDHILSSKKGLQVRETQGKETSGEASTVVKERSDEDLK